MHEYINYSECSDIMCDMRFDLHRRVHSTRNDRLWNQSNQNMMADEDEIMLVSQTVLTENLNTQKWKNIDKILIWSLTVFEGLDHIYCECETLPNIAFNTKMASIVADVEKRAQFYKTIIAIYIIPDFQDCVSGFFKFCKKIKLSVEIFIVHSYGDVCYISQIIMTLIFTWSRFMK